MPCSFEGHADLTASKTLLERQTEHAVRPMARPVRLTYDDHTWSEASSSRESPNEQRTDLGTVHRGWNVDSRES